MPVYKSNADTLSFEEYFVYLKSEEGKDSVETPSAAKVNRTDSQVHVNEKRENVPEERTEKEKADEQEALLRKEQEIQIIREGVIEHRVFIAEENYHETEETSGKSEEKQKEAGVNEKVSLQEQENTGDTVETSKEGVIVYEGTVLKTMPGFTIIPYEDASRIEILHARRREMTETEEKHDTEIHARQGEPSEKETEEEKEQKNVEVIEDLDDKMHENVKKQIESIKREIYRERGLLSEKATVTKDKVEAKVEVEEVPQIETTEKTKAKEKVEAEEQTEEKVKVEVEEDVKAQAQEQVQIQKVLKEEEEFNEIEEIFDRSRVEEKLKYMEYSMKEKKKKITEKQESIYEPGQKTAFKKKSIQEGKEAEPIMSIKEHIILSHKQNSTENNLVDKDIGKDLMEDIDNPEHNKDKSANHIVPHDILEIETGLVLASVPVRTAFPLEEELQSALYKEKPGESDEKTEEDADNGSHMVPEEQEIKIAGLKRYPLKIEAVIKKTMDLKELDRVITPPEIEYSAEEFLSEPLTERIIDTPFRLETEKSKESYQNDFQEKVTRIEEEDKKEQISAEWKNELKNDRIFEEKSEVKGLPIPNIFFKKDIKIEISMIADETAEISFKLFKKAHPFDEDGSMSRKEVEFAEDTSIDSAEGYKRVFSVERAEKGVYIFLVRNRDSKGYKTDVFFHIFEGKPEERKKEYKTIELPPKAALKYKFILPEAVFWDDEDYFTGTIESAKTMTKFNERTGLIWKEEKEY